MNRFSKKNKIIIIIIVFIIISLGMYFVYSKTDESKIFSYEDGIENKLEENTTKENETKRQNEEKNKMIVHITGSVVNEGILELDENSRISDAIEKAGGLKEGADVSQINLAFVISDGMKIYIPNLKDKEDDKNEDKTSTYITKESGVSTITDISSQDSNINVNIQASTKGAKVNINTAGIGELDTLPGIGDSTAQKIIDYRNENGKFNSIDDVKNVKGIGDSKFEKIKEYITIK